MKSEKYILRVKAFYQKHILMIKILSMKIEMLERLMDCSQVF